MGWELRGWAVGGLGGCRLGLVGLGMGVGELGGWGVEGWG